MGFSVSKDDRFVLIVISGFVNDDEAGAFQKQGTGLVESGERHFVLNLEKVHRLSSLGVGIIIQLWKEVVQVEGSLYVVCGNPHVKSVFRATHLDSVISVFDSLTDFRESMYLGSGQLPAVRAKHAYQIVDIREPFNIMAEAGYLNHLFEMMVNKGHFLIAVNLAGIRWIYSDVLSVFIKWVARLRAQRGELCLFGLTPELMERLESVRMSSVFRIYDNEDCIPSLN